MTNKTSLTWITRVAANLAIVGALLLALPTVGAGYVQTNLVSDIPGMAKFTDPDLVNPWGISHSSTSFNWVSDNGTGLATLYNGAGVKQGLVVTIPAPGGGQSAPTGQVFNSFAGMNPSFNSDLFIFATEGGTIAGWRGALGTTAEILDISGTGAVYKGLALASNSGNSYLYATDFHNATIKVLPGTGAPPLAGNFTDPNLPAGYAPFGIQNIGGKLYITYALQDAAKHDDVAGPGNGFVDVFDMNGNLVRRLISDGALNSPWGLALAPTDFGKFGGDLLVGNFGDGKINAFDPTSGALLGTLTDSETGDPIVNKGLWGLLFGNGANGGDADKLFFTAGIPGNGEIEDHGLFGSIAVPLPSTVMLLGSGLAGLLTFARARRKRA
jgi:uncharacterized protein (TIGR03118 family)